MSKKVIIIGGGLAGLSAGCYAAMNGFDTQIFEHHSVPGGVAATWKRGVYLIDGGIHFVMGHKPGNGMYNLLSDLGAIDPELYTDMDGYGKFIHEPSGISLEMGSNIDNFGELLKNMAPADAAGIDDLFKGARAMRGHDLSTLGMSQPSEISSLFSRVKEMWCMLPFARYFTGRYATSIGNYAAKLQTPWLRDFFCHLFIPESPAWFIMLILAIVADKQTGFLAKGCLPFVLAIENRYKTMGGKITYRSTVNKILVDNDKAVGVRLDDGQEFRADYVVSCADSYSTIFNLLEGMYLNDKTKNRFETWQLCRPYFTASFGVKREFNDDMTFNNIILDKPILIGDEPADNMIIRIFNYSNHFAPAGHTVFQIEMETGFDYWFNLQNSERTAYENQKQKIAGELLEHVEKYYPGIISQVEVTDIATPYTTWRYTFNHRASWGGWLLSADNFMQTVERCLPGLDNFYMAGHWVLGGVPGVLLSGRHAVQLICRYEGKKFAFTPPAVY